MHQDQMASPFSALTYQQQQDRWLEWRSRQLQYHPVTEETAAPEKPADSSPPLRQPPPLQPILPSPAPTRHGELDKLWAKHRQALRQAGQFRITEAGGKIPPPAANSGSSPE